jgi:hypothetical protein
MTILKYCYHVSDNTVNDNLARQAFLAVRYISTPTTTAWRKNNNGIPAYQLLLD